MARDCTPADHCDRRGTIDDRSWGVCQVTGGNALPPNLLLPPEDKSAERPVHTRAPHRTAHLPGPPGSRRRPRHAPVRNAVPAGPQSQPGLCCPTTRTDRRALCDRTPGQAERGDTAPAQTQRSTRAPLPPQSPEDTTCPCARRRNLGPSPALGAGREPGRPAGCGVQSGTTCYMEGQSH